MNPDPNETLDVVIESMASRRSDTPVERTLLDIATVAAAVGGLLLGIHLATAGRPALVSVLGGIVLFPLIARLAGHGLISLARRHGLLTSQVAQNGSGRTRREAWTVSHGRPEPPLRRRSQGEGRDIPPDVLVAWGRPGEAIRIYREAAEAAPSDAEPWIRIAHLERHEVQRPERALDALHRARERLPAGSREAGAVARKIAELHLDHLRNPRAAMPELARAAELLDGTPSGDWARRELADLKRRLAEGDLDRDEMRTPPPPPDLLQELDVLLRTRYGIVLIQTEEEGRVEALLRHAADRRRLPLFVWTPSKGLVRHGREDAVYDSRDPVKALRHIEAADLDALYYLRSLPTYLDRDDPALRHHLADAARTLEQRDGAIVLTGGPSQLPDEVRDLAAVLRLPGPEARDYRALLARVLQDVESRMRVKVEMTLPEQDQLLTNLRGLTLMEAEKLLTKVVVEDGRLTAADIEKVMGAKRDLIEREGVLEYYPSDTEWSEIADLAGLKAWLRQRRAVVTDPSRATEFGLSFPKGILLLGVPGCGKSLCAKAVAMDWRLPLLKLDPSTLYNKYIGETEKNFRRAMETAERMAPLVLWIDELEKAFASGEGEDGGVSRRVLGTFLSWMQERTGEVFVVATANDVQRLPPEFLRKGRFDEIFFVDLPDAETRAAIFAVHLRRRGQDPETYDLRRLAGATEGFSGAEIEQVVVSGLFHAFSEDEDLGADRLLKEAEQTRPLSVTMAEKVEGLRRWARGRTRSAQVVEQDTVS